MQSILIPLLYFFRHQVVMTFIVSDTNVHYRTSIVKEKNIPEQR